MAVDRPDQQIPATPLSGSAHPPAEAPTVRPSPRAALGSVRRWLRRAVEGALHARRRRAAHERVEKLGRVERVLFVCHGNIYRSPYAEAAFRDVLPPALRERIGVSSAGFVGPGRAAPAESVALAKERGLDLTSHRSRLVDPALLKDSDLVVVMSPYQAAEICSRYRFPRRRVLVMGDLDPLPIVTREVTDPWNRPYEVLVSSAERVTRCARELAETVAGSYQETGR